MFYKDLPNNLKIQTPLEDKEAIKQAVQNVLHTKKGSMPGKPDFGCPLDGYAFEMLDDTLKSLLIGDIKTSLSEIEPRIIVEDVIITFQEAYNRVDIEVKYSYSFTKTNEYESVNLTIEV